MYENVSCGELMKRIHEKMEKGLNESLSVYGITFTQLQMLMLLYQMKDEEVPLKSLEKHFEVAQSTAAGVVVRLEKKGLVTGFSSREDRRIKVIRLTEAGKAICASTSNEMEQGDRRLLAGLNEEEQQQLFKLLKKIIACL